MWGLLMFKRANLKRTWGLLMSTGPYGSYWLGIGFRKLHGKVPLANSNSFANSAACHPPEEDKNAAVKGVMWGEVHTGSDSEIGHCSFSSMDVTTPAGGKMYAGFRRRAAKEIVG